jgi:isoquinoline 1-oxidoreductase beta subunit
MSELLITKLQKRQRRTEIDRRNFLKLSGLSGVALVLGVSAKPGNKRLLAVADVAESYKLTPYIFIEKTGKITLMNPKPDMGQGTFQSVPALIAEELEVSLDAVTILQTAGEAEYGEQVSGGSTSVRMNYFSLRKVGASAKEMLLTAAAGHWKVPPGECYAENAKVYHKPSGRSIPYGELVEAASLLAVPQDPKLK